MAPTTMLLAIACLLLVTSSNALFRPSEHERDASFGEQTFLPSEGESREGGSATRPLLRHKMEEVIRRREESMEQEEKASIKYEKVEKEEEEEEERDNHLFSERERNNHHARLGETLGRKGYEQSMDKQIYDSIFGSGADVELPPVMKLVPVKEGEEWFDYVDRVTTMYAYNISLMEHERLPETEPQENPKFHCPKMEKSPSKPTSVHALRPSDVNIVAALGDSLSAALGAKSHNALDLLVEWRGVSWSIGGHGDISTVKTLANIIKYYNKDVKGYSIGPTPPKKISRKFPEIEQLNVAVSGAVSYNLTDQAKYLVKQMRMQRKYDFFGDWKVLTVFIGGNDLCASCKDGKVERYLPENFIREVRSSLDYLHKTVPKMFVNLVTPPDVPLLQLMNDTRCNAWHYVMCKCGTVYGPAARALAHDRWVAYNRLEKELVDSGRYDTREDFTVVLQPFFTQTNIPETKDGYVDQTYFAPDCFHFSQKAHSASALALWNSMIEPVGNKRTKWSAGEEFECPSAEMPYLYTAKNSKKPATEVLPTAVLTHVPPTTAVDEKQITEGEMTVEIKETVEIDTKGEEKTVVIFKEEILKNGQDEDVVKDEDEKKSCTKDYEFPFHMGVRFILMYGVLPLLAFALIFTTACYVSKMGKDKKLKQPYVMEVTMDAFEYEDKQRLL